MAPRVWHLRLARADAEQASRWIAAGTFDPPAASRVALQPRDYVFLHREDAGAIAVGRVLSRGPGRLAVEWARFPRPLAMLGVPRGAGLRMARAFSWDQKELADSMLGPPS